MATYVNVTQQEMENHLFPQEFTPLSLPGTVELVYSKRVDRDGMMLSLRVFTGINPGGNSRKVGEDAIRVQIVWRQGDGTVRIVGGSRRVHRVKGWRKNLQNRIDSWQEQLGPSCPECSAPMVERKGRKGVFWGCSRWPDCKRTMNIPSAEECRAEAEIRQIEGGQI